jgi:hypothetical protein
MPKEPAIDSKPAIATWELWSVANMLISTHGDDAETHAQGKLTEALDQGDEGGQIVWTGIITQLSRIRPDHSS